MTQHASNSKPSRRTPRLVHTAVLMASALVSLWGCADTHWERAFYQGAVEGNAQCQLKRRPTDAPCNAPQGYDSFERERLRAKNESPPSSRAYPIQEQQQ